MSASCTWGPLLDRLSTSTVLRLLTKKRNRASTYWDRIFFRRDWLRFLFCLCMNSAPQPRWIHRITLRASLRVKTVMAGVLRLPLWGTGYDPCTLQLHDEILENFTFGAT
jgi:hypothetical protein